MTKHWSVLFLLPLVACTSPSADNKSSTVACADLSGTYICQESGKPEVQDTIVIEQNGTTLTFFKGEEKYQVGPYALNGDTQETDDTLNLNINLKCEGNSVIKRTTGGLNEVTKAKMKALPLQVEIPKDIDMTETISKTETGLKSSRSGSDFKGEIKDSPELVCTRK